MKHMYVVLITDGNHVIGERGTIVLFSTKSRAQQYAAKRSKGRNNLDDLEITIHRVTPKK